MFFRKKSDIKRPLFRRIINYFLGAGVGLFVILLIAFGYTQTSSFRNWLKDFIIEQANSSTNGKLSIGNLDGTIFTSLILSNTVYTLDQDTIFSSQKIELKVSPLRVFLKTIYLRKLEIENANISLLKDENGELNISRITSPGEEEVEEVKDTVTTSQPFSWKIDVADLTLKNVNFKHQTIANKNSNVYYPQPYMDDLRLENLNLSLSASADIAGNEYQIIISEFSASPNLTGFKLLNLSGNFVLLSDMAGVTDLKIITERSYISLNAAISDFYLFNSEEVDLNKSPVRVEMSAMNFDFDDLTNFIDGTDILKGSIETHVTAQGNLSELELENLEVKFNETNLNASGFIQNVLGGDQMMISVKFRDSYINQDDVTNLLPSIGIPTYKDYGVLQFDSLSFEGKPLDFSANMLLQTEKGGISGLVKMNLSGDEIEYDYQIKTTDLNLKPVAGLNSNLNLTGSLKGKGFSPENLETSIQIEADESTIEEIYFRDFKINADGSDGIINTAISFNSAETQGSLDAQFNFADTTSTKYNFNMLLAGFNLDDFVKESGINTELNIKLTGDGENFDQDRLNLFAILEIDSSRLDDINIDSTTLIADIRSGEKNRVINIISDLADLTISGEFTLAEAIEVISNEIQLVSNSIQNKIEKIQPPDFRKINTQPVVNVQSKNLETYEPVKRLDAQYLLELKSFELLSLFLGNAEIEVDGEITGKLAAIGDTTILTLDTKIDQMKYWDGVELYYLSDFDFAAEINSQLYADTFDGFSADINVDAKRIFIGGEISDLKFDLNFDGNDAQIGLDVTYDSDTKLNLAGGLFINEGFVDVNFNQFRVSYIDFDLANDSDLKFSYSNDSFNFESFKLVHNGGTLDLNGILSLSGTEDLRFKLQTFKIKDLSTNLLGISPDQSFGGELNLDFVMTGTAQNPLMKLEYSIDSLKIQNYSLGSIQSTASYESKLLEFDVDFLALKNEQQNKSLGIEGSLPIDLSFYAEKRNTGSDVVDIKLFADNFDLRFAGGFFPGIKNMRGLLNGNVSVYGPYGNILNDGELTITNSSFILEVVNLTYLLDAKINFIENKVILTSLNLSNESNMRDGGTITASGEIAHHNFSIENINMRASGELKLFDQRSKAVNPSLYGDIAVRTNSDLIFTSTKERNYLNVDLILKNGANVTYSPTQSAFSNENDKFTYVFSAPVDEDILEKEIDSLILIAEQKKEELESESEIPFDFDFKIEVEKEAKVIFVLSREFKQNLTAYLGGKVEYSEINELPIAKGELTLLDGSKLDFIKTFQANGNIRFLDEIDNPYVDVTATYESFYSPDTVRTGTNEWDVRIIIKLEGPAKSITANFLQDENNISVYRSRRNANQYELDATKTGSDAMFFIIVNKFPEDASMQESNFAASTAASLAGSIVGSVLNEKLGDVVRSVNVQQVGTETQFSLIGKVADFRYEIGGTSQVFQDLSRANVKIEHPLFFPNFIIRFDRREPPYQSSTYSEMINELGLKYSFVF
ncbi:MAG: hypothetical protein IPM14_10305 [bacterium]|nr:hypothetical protein [bacterium]